MTIDIRADAARYYDLNPEMLDDRCYYPEEFTATILKNGFEILNCWGGYLGEPYGEGPELVVEFRNPS